MKRSLTDMTLVPEWFLDAKRTGADNTRLRAHTRAYCGAISGTIPDEGWVEVMHAFYETAYRAALTT